MLENQILIAEAYAPKNVQSTNLASRKKIAKETFLAPVEYAVPQTDQ